MDVDEFKAVNDTYGHGYGDDVLREAGRLMLEEMMGKGIAARFGGEEFMLVFEQDDRDQVLNSFRNIQEGLRRYSQNTRQTDITISGGMERYELINSWIYCLLLWTGNYILLKITVKTVLWNSFKIIKNACKA